MAKYKVEISGVDTSNIPVLSSEEMNELFCKMHEGDPFARSMLVEGNLKLVLSILKRFHNKYDNLDDLFQIGCIGLLKAIDNFDLGHEVKFSTYAVPMILGEIKRYLRDNNSSIRVSRSIKDTAYKTLKFQEEYFQEHGVEASCEEVAKNLGVTSFDVYNALESMKEPISIFSPIYSDGGDTIYVMDQIEDSKTMDQDFSMILSLDNAKKHLNDREQMILEQRFMIGKTQMEIANELSISQAQVSRLEKGAIKTLKKVLK